jgi:transposase-like protein
MKAEGKKRAIGKPAKKVQRAKGKAATRPGRPISYDPVHCARIVAHAETGAPVAEYADAIGVPPSTLIEWARTHPEFLKALQLALATLGLEMVQRVNKLKIELVQRVAEIESRLFAATDPAELDALLRTMADFAPNELRDRTDSFLVWNVASPYDARGRTT